MAERDDDVLRPDRLFDGCRCPPRLRELLSLAQDLSGMFSVKWRQKGAGITGHTWLRSHRASLCSGSSGHRKTEVRSGHLNLGIVVENKMVDDEAG